MDDLKLPPETASLWHRLEHEPLLGGAYLLGGTALSLKLQHRISEDLDFFFPANKLPTDRLSKLWNAMQTDGHQMGATTHWPTYDEFQLAGESLYDYHQSWIVDNKVKVSFTTFGDNTAGLLTTPVNQNRPVVPSVGELFATKAVLVSKRHKTRDWVDLYVLMKNHGFTTQDFCAAYEKAGKPQQAGEALKNLTNLIAPDNDEGYRALLSPAPTLNDISRYFSEQYEKFIFRPKTTPQGEMPNLDNFANRVANVSVDATRAQRRDR